MAADVMPKAKKVAPAIVTMKPIFLSIHQVSEAMSLSETVIKKMVESNKFPASREISKKRVAWLARELKEWAEMRPLSDMLPPGPQSPIDPSVE